MKLLSRWGLLLIWAVPVIGQSVSDPAPACPLALAAAVQRALSLNHDIAIERDSVVMAGATLRQGEAAYDPLLKLDLKSHEVTYPYNNILAGSFPINRGLLDQIQIPGAF